MTRTGSKSCLNKTKMVELKTLVTAFGLRLVSVRERFAIRCFIYILHCIWMSMCFFKISLLFILNRALADNSPPET